MEFTGCVQANGYARATVQRKADYAHRHIYRLLRGPIAPGLDVCHRCDNRKCINPDHLFLGTRKENMADAVSKGRQAKGAMLPQTKVLEFIVDEIGRMARAGMLYKDVAKAFGISRHRVGQIAIKQGVRRRGLSE